jgi:hypothetical protein
MDQAGDEALGIDVPPTLLSTADMEARGDYLQSQAEVGSIVCHGPVDDPNGGGGCRSFLQRTKRRLSVCTAKLAAKSRAGIGGSHCNLRPASAF